MPAIPAPARSSVTLRILLHAKERWPRLRELEVTCRGAFAYASAVLPGEEEPQPLFRLRYGGSAHAFGFALYSHAAGRYEDAVLLTGLPTGTPQEALDTACTLYLAGTGEVPESGPLTNLRTEPHSGASPHPKKSCQRVAGVWRGGAVSGLRFPVRAPAAGLR